MLLRSQSPFNVASGAVLDLNGFNETLGSLAGAGNVTLGSGTLTAGGNNASTTYSGTISGSGGFNKAGSGTLLLTGTATIPEPPTSMAVPSKSTAPLPARRASTSMRARPLPASARSIRGR